jgi:hypothetical protein
MQTLLNGMPNLPYLEQQHQGEEIDQAIAVRLFGWPAEVVQDPNFPLPAYSTDSATTCKILEKVMSLPEQQRERFRKRVRHWLPDEGKNLPFEQLLYFATEPGIESFTSTKITNLRIELNKIYKKGDFCPKNRQQSIFAVRVRSNSGGREELYGYDKRFLIET